MSHNRHSRSKLRRKYPLLQWPFAYTNRNNAVVFLCSCSRSSDSSCSAPDAVPAYHPNFPALIRCAKSTGRKGPLPPRSVTLCSPGRGRTCQGKGGKGAAALPGRSRYMAGAGPRAATGESKSLSLVGKRSHTDKNSPGEQPLLPRRYHEQQRWHRRPPRCGRAQAEGPSGPSERGGGRNRRLHNA